MRLVVSFCNLQPNKLFIMIRNVLFFALVLCLSIVMTACEKDDPEIPNEEELITTVNYTLTPTDGGMSVLVSFVDLDGDGGSAATITGGTLEANQTYTGSLELLNESETPSEDITAEIEEEDEDHQFFFSSDIAGLSFSYNDQDEDGNPVGLSSTVTTGDAASGSITIVLKHEPVKSATGVSDGDITNAGGETDIEVTFPIDVQ